MTDAEIQNAIKEEQKSNALKLKTINAAKELVEKLEEAGWKTKVNYHDSEIPSTIGVASTNPDQMQLMFSPRMTYEDGHLPRISFLDKKGNEIYCPNIRFEYKYEGYSYSRYHSSRANSFKVLLETGGYGTGPGRIKTYSNRKNGRGLNVEQILMRLQEYADSKAAQMKAEAERETKRNRREEILEKLQVKHNFKTYSSPVVNNSGYTGGRRGKWFDYGGIKFTMSFSATDEGEETLGKLLQLIDDNMPELLDNYRNKE